jgi:hypothetical protein
VNIECSEKLWLGEAVVEYAFVPVRLDCADEGCYFQFRRVTPAIGGAGVREPDLNSMRVDLLTSAALIITGRNFLAHAADDLARAGWTWGACRNRWARVQIVRDYGTSSTRKNGTVNVCKQDLAGRSGVLDALLDDDAPLWHLVGQGKWDLGELVQMWPRIVNRQLPLPPLWDDDWSEARNSWCKAVEAAGHPGPQAVASAAAFFFCLRRAQTVGSLHDYMMAYYGIVCAMRSLSGGALSAAEQKSETDFPTVLEREVERLILTDFWRRLGNFVQVWHSRIRACDNSRIRFEQVGSYLAETFGNVVGGLVVGGAAPYSKIDFIPEHFLEPYFSKQRELELCSDGRSCSLEYTVPRYWPIMCER